MAAATPWIGLKVKSNATKSVWEEFLKDTEIGADARGFFSSFISSSKSSDLLQKDENENENESENEKWKSKCKWKMKMEKIVGNIFQAKNTTCVVCWLKSSFIGHSEIREMLPSGSHKIINCSIAFTGINVTVKQ